MNPRIQLAASANRAVFYPPGAASLSGFFTVPSNVLRLRVIAQAPGGGGGGSASAGTDGGSITFTNLFIDTLTSTAVTVRGGIAGNDVTPGGAAPGPGMYAGIAGTVSNGGASPFSAGAVSPNSATFFQFGVGGSGAASFGGGSSGAFMDRIFTVIPGQQINFIIGAAGTQGAAAGDGGRGIIIFEWILT